MCVSLIPIEQVDFESIITAFPGGISDGLANDITTIILTNMCGIKGPANDLLKRIKEPTRSIREEDVIFKRLMEVQTIVLALHKHTQHALFGKIEA